MNPSEIPDELVELLDDRAGKKHSRDGSVMTTLAEILTRWEQIRRQRVRDESRRNPSMYDETVAELRQRAVDAEAEAERLRGLLRDVDLFGHAFVYSPAGREPLTLHPADVTVHLRADAVTTHEAALKLVAAAEAWRDRVAGLILGSHELPLADAVDEWRNRG